MKALRLSEKATITKTVWQHTKLLAPETVEFLKGIAEDYRKVKNYVYRRYSGIGSMNRLVPVYDILTEMRHSGLRESLNLPVVYYELAIAEAVLDIRTMWSTLKNRIRELAGKNLSLRADDLAYIRTILKFDSIFSAILLHEAYEMPKNLEEMHPDVHRLENLLRRLTRRHRSVPEAGMADSFRVSPAGYRYRDGGLYIVSRIPRKRVLLPLKDGLTSDRQLRIYLRDGYAEIAVPIEKEIREPAGESGIYIYIGYRDALTLSNGHIYGAELNRLVSPETERLDRKNRERGRAYRAYKESVAKGQTKKALLIEENNLGCRKYNAIKQRERNRTEQFVNAELNRMLREERPSRIVITKTVKKTRTKYHNPALNRKLTRSFGSFIRERLRQKCLENGIELTEISSKGTASSCSACGAVGKREKEYFICGSCGLTLSAAENSARNIEKLAKSHYEHIENRNRDPADGQC